MDLLEQFFEQGDATIRIQPTRQEQAPSAPGPAAVNSTASTSGSTSPPNATANAAAAGVKSAAQTAEPPTGLVYLPLETADSDQDFVNTFCGRKMMAKC